MYTKQSRSIKKQDWCTTVMKQFEGQLQFYNHLLFQNGGNTGHIYFVFIVDDSYVMYLSFQ